jgi:hypothetical protein
MTSVLSGKRADIRATLILFLTSPTIRCWSGTPPRGPFFNDIFDELTEIDFQLLPNVRIDIVQGYIDEILAWESKLPPFPEETQHHHLFLDPVIISSAWLETNHCVRRHQIIELSGAKSDDCFTDCESDGSAQTLLQTFRAIGKPKRHRQAICCTCQDTSSISHRIDQLN